MAHAIFISYRRDDTEGEAGRLYDDLVREFGDDGVFMDVAGISPGIDFRRAIEDNVSSCGVLLAMIGPTWATIADSSGKRRLEDPDDFVSLEITSALRRKVPVIPVLVHDARMPHPEQLPDTLKDLAYRNSVELTHARWNSDTGLLVQALKAYVTPAKATDEEPVHATVAVQLPAPHPEAPQAAAATRSKTPLIVGGIAAALAIGAVYFALRPAPRPQPLPVPVARQSSTSAMTAVSGPAASAGTLLGRWVAKEERAGNSLDILEITGSGNRIFLHAWGTCKPVRCDWGTRPAVFDGQTATATFTPEAMGGVAGSARLALVKAQPAGGNLEVLVQNSFENQSATRTNQRRRTFVPAK